MMEQLGEAFAGSLSVGRKENDTAIPHPRLSQFKQKYCRNSQEERRVGKLEAQKRDRLDYVNKARCLAEEDWKDIEDEKRSDEEEEAVEEMDSDSSKRRKKRPRYYRNQLMLSEWLVDVPTRLAQDWLMVFCPVGKRTLVVAAKGRTSSYTKAGYRLTTFPSSLPGGSRRNKHNKSDYTILDCIFHEASRAFYILDIMCWRGHPVYDSDTEFRFFWLQAKMAEEPELAVHKSTNPYVFLPLSNYACHSSHLQQTMSEKAPFEADVDGLLFYHKETHYIPGTTPLVGWLKPWMLPDMLGIPVPDSILDSRPPGASMKPPDTTMESTTTVSEDPTAKVVK